jgi:hypothetical protein
MKEPLGGWSCCLAGCTLKIVRIFCGSGDCPAAPESLAVRRDCTEQLIKPNQERSRHRVAPDPASSASRWSWPHLARDITEAGSLRAILPWSRTMATAFLVRLGQSLRSSAWQASNQECCRIRRRLNAAARNVKATDYVGQAIRRYRKNTGFFALRASHDFHFG